MANKKAKKKAAARAAVAPADKATMVVTLYDGTREPIEDQDFLIRIFDGFQNQLFDDFKPAPTTVFSLDPKGRPALHVLADILMQADPQRPDRLLYCYRRMPGGRIELLVTTRNAADAAGRTIPNEYRSGPR